MVERNAEKGKKENEDKKNNEVEQRRRETHGKQNE